MKNKLTTERYLKAEHLQLKLRDGHDVKHSKKNRELLAKRKIKLTTPYISVALYILRKSNLIAMLPKNVVTSLKEQFSIQPPPFKLPNITICQAWPKQLDNDLAHKWLRDVIKNYC